jgi:5-methylcytosine-specific restriction enzyme subunit McrC
MLEYAYGLKSFQFLDGRVELKKIDDLFEELASVLSKMVLERNRKGLYRDYVRREEPLPYIKGRILIRKSLKSSVRGAINLDCEYDENTADIMDNRILAWTLYRIPRLNIQREEIRRQVGRAYRAISGSVDVNHVNSTDCINRFYHRLNEDYRPMHALCRFFLEQCGPMTDNGDHEFLPFVLNMPILFESFVAEWLRANLPSEMQLKSQFWADLDSEGILSFRIDLVIEDIASGKVLAVLDTKYKRPAMPSQQDITQIIAYAVRMGTDKAFLIYPSVATNIMDFKTGDINVGSLIFDISKNPDDSGNLFLQTLINKINMN